MGRRAVSFVVANDGSLAGGCPGHSVLPEVMVCESAVGGCVARELIERGSSYWLFGLLRQI